MTLQKQRTCDTCGVSFLRHGKPGKNGSFCTLECRNAAKIRTCENCGDRFHCLDAQKKTCSNKCRVEQTVSKLEKREYRTCKWCGKKFHKTPSRLKSKIYRHCSRHCVDSRARFVAWMRAKQREYKKRLAPKAESSTGKRFSRDTWEGWCHFAARETHEYNPETIEQRWKRRVCSMCSINRHRETRAQNRNTKKQNRGETWEDRVKQFAKFKKRKDIYSRWMTKLDNARSNHRKRMQRKHKAEMSRQED